MKIVYSEIINGQLQLPAEALAVLPEGVKLCLLIDSAKGRVTVHAQDPTVLQNQSYFDEMAEEMADVDWRDYYDAQPPYDPSTKKKNESSGEQ